MPRGTGMYNGGKPKVKKAKKKTQREEKAVPTHQYAEAMPAQYRGEWATALLFRYDNRFIPHNADTNLRNCLSTP